jgi:hypothetical protein
MVKTTWALIALAYLSFAEILSLTPVPDLSLCLIQPEYREQSRNTGDEKYCPPFHVGVVLAFQTVNSVLERHDKSVVGGFTVVLALSTIGLWLATNKLWKAGERQLELLRSTSLAQSFDMRASIRAATDAVQNGIDANQIAITNSEQQLRAYVTATNVNLVLHRGPGRMSPVGNVVLDGPVHTYRLSAILRNGGQTPATNVVTNVSCSRLPKSIPDDFTFPDAPEFGHGIVGPDGEIQTLSVEISANEFERVDDLEWYLWGWIEYDDIFSGTSRHRTEFCFEIDRSRLQGSNELWVGFKPLSKYNAVDDGCLRGFYPVENEYR